MGGTWVRRRSSSVSARTGRPRVGDRGCSRAARRPRFRATLRSSLWLTEPVGGPPQGWFVNAGGRGRDGSWTRGAPGGLPRHRAGDGACARGEERPAHDRRGHPLFGGERRAGPGLVIPTLGSTSGVSCSPRSPRSAPGLVHPVLGLAVRELLARCPDASAVRLHRPSEARPDGVPLRRDRRPHRGGQNDGRGRAGGEDRRQQGARGLGGEPFLRLLLRRQAGLCPSSRPSSSSSSPVY